jgi:hypothetical protein
MIDKEEGIAYGWFIICLTVILGALLYLAFMIPVNSIVDVTNTEIADGMITQQSENAISFNVTMFSAIPIILLAGLLMYGVIRAIYRRAEVVY